MSGQFETKLGILDGVYVTRAEIIPKAAAYCSPWDTNEICSQGTNLLLTLVGNIVLDLFDDEVLERVKVFTRYRIFGQLEAFDA